MSKKKKIRYNRIIIALIILIIIIFLIIKGISYLFYMRTLEYKLINIGYSELDTKILINNLDDNIINKILKENKEDKELLNFVSINNFDYNLLINYKDYFKKNPKLSYEDVVVRVNIGLNNDFYTNIKKIKEPERIDVLVNKYNTLDKAFIPSTLIKVSNQYAYGDVELSKECLDNFINLFNAVKLDGMKIVAISGYRSYEAQDGIYNNSLKNNTEAYTNLYIAKPGHSEHQTGLAIDIADGKLPYNDFEKTKSYEWLKDNAHKYGFIIRYQEKDESITGYKNEPWHIRYVGLDISNYIYQNNITFDEYYVKYIKGR